MLMAIKIERERHTEKEKEEKKKKLFIHHSVLRIHTHTHITHSVAKYKENAVFSFFFLLFFNVLCGWMWCCKAPESCRHTACYILEKKMLVSMIYVHIVRNKSFVLSLKNRFCPWNRKLTINFVYVWLKNRKFVWKFFYLTKSINYSHHMVIDIFSRFDIRRRIGHRWDLWTYVNYQRKSIDTNGFVLLSKSPSTITCTDFKKTFR